MRRCNAIKDSIGVAVVGLGRVAKTHLDSIRLNPDTTRLVAVVDINELLAKAVAESCNVRFYTSVEAALNDPQIQAMVICLSHDLHKPVALQVMESGRHVLVEKPMAINFTDGKEMVKKALEKGVVLMVGQSQRFISGFQEAKLRMKDDIGEPFNLVNIAASGFHCVQTPVWWQDQEKTGGLAFTLVGSHAIDFTLYMYEGKKPVRVFCEARSINPKIEGMDEITIVISFNEGEVATNHISLNTYPEKFEGYIVGSKGMISYRRFKGPVELVGVFSCDLFINGKLKQRDVQKPHNFALQMGEFSEAILQGREPFIKNREILTQLAILDAAKKSAETHQPIFL